MKKLLIVSIVCLSVMFSFGPGAAVAAKDVPGVDPCLACHDSVTPGIVKQWHDSKHSQVGVKCYVCHQAKESDPSGYDHNGYKITAVPSPKYCESCHGQEVAEYTNSKHAWTAFIGPLKVYYLKAKEMGLDPMAQSTAKKLNPLEMAKRTLSPMYPSSGILKKVGLLDDPAYNHNNVTLGCLECHGSFMIAGKDGKLEGWPNSGVGRINPDGSLGACTSCHTRHTFSVAEARKPETCGQCHLGPDHPQIEIYTESKHGNIYGSSGESWNWDVPPGQWGPRDIVAPTCATCHMSAFGGVKGSHDAGARLYWELQPKKSVPQWKSPEQSKDYIKTFESDKKLAERQRGEMKKICGQCHSTRWTDSYFVEFDKVVSDYNMLWYKVDTMLKDAYTEGLISKDNPIDETPEIQHYLIWHHDGRRWRMGASMMGPDYTHWNGAVDGIMNKFGTMINDLEMRRMIKDMDEKKM
jgi:hydroxylamine dehydrogenase